jgi:hypothetical protein
MTNSLTENAIRFLDSLRRPDLAALLFGAEVDFGTDGTQYVVVVRTAQPFAEALRGLSPYDRRRIAEAAVSQRSDYRAPEDLNIREKGEPVEGPGTLLPDLIIHREMMTSVSTGGRQIQDVDDYYAARQAKIVENCAAVGIVYENKFSGLWEWYHFWKENFGSYAERRNYLRGLFSGPIAAAASRMRNPSPIAEREPSGWERVDRSLSRARSQLSTASTEEEWQTVGLLCREVLISLAQAIYDPAIHTTEDGVIPSATDANRMTEAYVGHAFPGESYKEVRSHARAALALALNLQHRRTATRQLALLCIEGTSSAVAVIAIIAGRTR